MAPGLARLPRNLDLPGNSDRWSGLVRPPAALMIGVPPLTTRAHGGIEAVRQGSLGTKAIGGEPAARRQALPFQDVDKVCHAAPCTPPGRPTTRPHTATAAQSESLCPLFTRIGKSTSRDQNNASVRIAQGASPPSVAVTTGEFASRLASRESRA